LVSDIPAGEGKIVNLFLKCSNEGGRRRKREGWMRGRKRIERRRREKG
jgi:hypothetical protein